MACKIQTCAELQRMIRKALREQHPEWIDIDGRCTLCDVYEARFAKLLRIFARHAAGQIIPRVLEIELSVLGRSAQHLPNSDSCQAAFSAWAKSSFLFIMGRHASEPGVVGRAKLAHCGHPRRLLCSKSSFKSSKAPVNYAFGVVGRILFAATN
jgi:hypothetical protein